MTRCSNRYVQVGTIHRSLSVALILFAIALATPCRADDADWIGSAPVRSQPEMRSGGVLDESFAYHRQSNAAPQAAAPPGGGWYGYGFPVQTYRWGWFGAAHYYPTVLWHRTYNGDECRWAYRCGY